MKQVFELRQLTEDFYNDYPKDIFPEIERKRGRPYAVLLVQIEGLKFAIPLRTNIRHHYCYRFKTSDRKTQSSTGIDFSKAIVVTKNSYLGEQTNINNKEYIELKRRCFFIKRKFEKFIQNFLKVLKKEANQYIVKRYQYSTLKYFKDYFDINSK